MRVSISKEFDIEAAHYLPGHTGKCKELHGHRWQLKVTVSCEEGILHDGMVMDFSDLKQIVQVAVIDAFDHRNFNDVLPKDLRPTSENIALFIFKKLSHIIDVKEQGLILLDSISLKETEKSECIVRRKNG